jgi:pimeloyl-ACP methyl ester carboxylesterase
MREADAVRPLVIAVHGAVANAATWIPVRRCLAGECELRAADLPGHGSRRSEPFVLDAAIGELTRELKAAAVQRPVFVTGDSLGGYLALAAAAQAGPAVAGVIAGSCTFPMRGSAASMARLSLVADVVTAEWPFILLTRVVASPEVSAAIVAGGFAPAMRGLTLRALLGRDVLADVAAIDAPVIFVDGAFDLPIALYARGFARAARRGRYVIIPRAGHGVALTHPTAFAAAIRDCIAAASSVSSIR